MKTNLFRKNHLSSKWGMRIMRLALLLFPLLGRGLGGGCVLFAQNGVTVSNLAVDAGTVTFNVSWQTPMPVALWSDTVWVFVDYNNAGKMERLPVTGATASTGTVTKIPNNDKGVWVAGNARTSGSFSATVKLLTEVKNVGGACVYGSNYPPVGEYSSSDASEIKFTGTPKYDLILEKIADGSTYTIATTGLYSIHAGEVIQSFTDATGAPGIMKGGCTAPGSTVNFTAFNPCSNAVTGDYWYITDTRESNNTQTYKVKLMADGRIWMVQDLKFGNKCNKTTFTGSTKDLTGNITSLTDKTYYGDCTAATNTSTPSNRGYLYDWAAAINKASAYTGSSSDVGCNGTGSGTSGTNPGACQGICPIGWHIPTANSAGEFKRLHDAIGGCSTSNDNCWNSSSAWEGVYGGERNPNNGSLASQGAMGHYWSSTYWGSSYAYALTFSKTSCNPVGNATGWQRHYARSVRCVMND